MADQGLWFKLWCASLDDPNLDNLSIADFGRWAKLGAYIKRHGRAGSLEITAPARALCAMLQLPDFAAFHALISRLPNVNEESEKCNGQGETITTVTYVNWPKYQGDLSSFRVRRFREMKRSKRRGDEKRRDEIKNKKREQAPGPQNGPVSAPSNGWHQIPDGIAKALSRAPRLGADPRLQQPAWWQAHVRLNPALAYPEEVLRAEAWLVANPQKAPRGKDLSRFLHNWLGRATAPTEA